MNNKRSLLALWLMLASLVSCSKQTEQNAESPEPSSPKEGSFGALVRQLDLRTSKALGLLDNAGVIITSVRPGGTADSMGLKSGDVIREMDGLAVGNRQRFNLFLQYRSEGDALSLKVLNPSGTRSTVGTLKDALSLEDSLSWINQCAVAGDINAKCMMADAYLRGADGLRKNTSEGLKLATQAEQAGNPEAFIIIGQLYLHGAGVRKDEGKAAQMFLKAAEAGMPEGMLYYGQMLPSGTGVSLDEEEAVNWFRKASELDLGDAYAFLARCYLEGKGVPENPVTAYEMSEMGSKLGNAAASGISGHCLETGKGTGQDLNRAVDRYRFASIKGDIDATFALAAMKAEGRGCRLDVHESRRLFEKVAATGDPRGHYGLGISYTFGDGRMFKPNLVDARRHLRIAAEKGISAAHAALERLDEGLGVE
jgi:TPR repeat protein